MSQVAASPSDSTLSLPAAASSPVKVLAPSPVQKDIEDEIKVKIADPKNPPRHKQKHHHHKRAESVDEDEEDEDEDQDEEDLEDDQDDGTAKRRRAQLQASPSAMSVKSESEYNLSHEEKQWTIKQNAASFRLAQLILSIAAFALMASTTFKKDSLHLEFYEVPEFQFLVAVGGMLTAYSLLSHEDYCLRAYFCCAPQMSAEKSAQEGVKIDHVFQATRVSLDLLFTMLSLAAGVAAAIRCGTEHPLLNQKICEGNTQGIFSVIAIFVVSPCLMVTALLEWNRWRQQEASEQERVQRTVLSSPSRPNLLQSPSATDVKDPSLTEWELQVPTQGYFQGSTSVQKFFSIFFRVLELASAVLVCILLGSREIAIDIQFYELVEFQFMFGVVLFSGFYAAVVLALQLYKSTHKLKIREITSYENITRPMRFVFDLVFFTLCLAAGIAGGTRCSRKLASEATCDSNREKYVAAALALLSALLFLFSSLLSWTQWLKQRVGEQKSAVARMMASRSRLEEVAMSYSTDFDNFQDTVRVMTLKQLPGIKPAHLGDRPSIVPITIIHLVAAALASMGIIALAVKPIGIKTTIPKLTSLKFYDVPEFQFTFCICCLVVVYAGSWLLVRSVNWKHIGQDEEEGQKLRKLEKAKRKAAKQGQTLPAETPKQSKLTRSYTGTIGPVKMVHFTDESEKALSSYVLFVNVAFLALTVCAGIASAVRCSQRRLYTYFFVVLTDDFCADSAEAAGPIVAIIASFLLSICFVYSTYLNYDRWWFFKGSQEARVFSNLANSVYSMSHQNLPSVHTVPIAGSNSVMGSQPNFNNVGFEVLPSASTQMRMDRPEEKTLNALPSAMSTLSPPAASSVAPAVSFASLAPPSAAVSPSPSTQTISPSPSIDPDDVQIPASAN